jgi:hypothetical protein
VSDVKIGRVCFSVIGFPVMGLSISSLRIAYPSATRLMKHIKWLSVGIFGGVENKLSMDLQTHELGGILLCNPHFKIKMDKYRLYKTQEK